MFDELYHHGHSNAVQWARNNQEKLLGLAKESEIIIETKN